MKRRQLAKRRSALRLGAGARCADDGDARGASCTAQSAVEEDVRAVEESVREGDESIWFAFVI